ncbi:MAG: ABC transporter permease [Chthonomonadaceae bacterium]|nr:ABC transporter permease [Chthonomonadaceae bacterium]
MKSPLAPYVFLLRNLSKSTPLAGVIVLAVLLISGIVVIMNSIPLSIRTTYSYSRFHTGVTPRGNPAMTPTLKKIILDESPVALGPLMTCRAADCEVKSIVGPWRFVVIALEQNDMRSYAARLGATKLTGRWPRKGEPEAVVSEPILKNMQLKMGSAILKPEDSNNYSPKPVKIVGVLRTDQWLAMMPIEYHRANHFPPIDLLVVMAKSLDEQDKLDHWIYERFKGMQARVFAYFKLEEETTEMFKILYSILNVVIGLLVIVITLMMALLMNIYQSQRVQEFGLLQAIGLSRNTLLRRILAESAIVVFLGWVMGLVSSLAFLSLIRKVLFDPRAFMLDPFDRTAYLYTVPVPIVIFAVSALTIWTKFHKFDPVGVVERRLV